MSIGCLTCKLFLDCVSNSALGHIKTVSSLFTWTNKRASTLIHKRLDRMLGNKEWFNLFSEAVVVVKNRGLMDHCPLLCTIPLQLEKIRKSFQFQNYMTEVNGFLDSVSKAWATPWFGDPMAILNQKLKEVRSALIVLNKSHGNVHNNVSLARAILSDVQE